jgi:uncharacterized membrane protein YdjX (TVP38/TMEM64 family)
VIRGERGEGGAPGRGRGLGAERGPGPGGKAVPDRGEEGGPSGGERTGSGGMRWIRLAVLAAVVVSGLLLLGRVAGGRVDDFIRWVEEMGAVAPVVFVVGYAVATVAFVPGVLLTLAAGAVFGIVRGVAYVWIGAVLGSTGSFLVARYLARDAVERRIRHDPRFELLDRRVAQEGLKLVLLLRLTPIMPYNVLNYALGVTGVRLSHYLLGALGMLPGTLFYVYSGRVAGDVATAVAGEPVARGPGYWAVLGLGLAATLVLTVVVTRMARAALRTGVVSEAGASDGDDRTASDRGRDPDDDRARDRDDDRGRDRDDDRGRDRDDDRGRDWDDDKGRDRDDE